MSELFGVIADGHAQVVDICGAFGKHGDRRDVHGNYRSHGNEIIENVPSVPGFPNLARHIALRFPEVSENEVTEYAIALFELPMKRHARGLVRADLYLHWRYAQFGTLSKDLVDDVYHVLNSSYCEIYATADPKQSYAPLLLTSNTKVSTWNRTEPVDKWLEAA